MFKMKETDGPFAAKGPGAMEKMVANMLGFTPEEMHATLTDFRATIIGTAERMTRIEQKLDAVLASQNGGDNEQRRISGNDGRIGHDDDGRGRTDGHPSTAVVNGTGDAI